MEFIKRIFKNYLDGKATTTETVVADTWYEETGKQPTPEWITRESLDRAKAETLQNLSAQLNLPLNKLQQRSTAKVFYIRKYLPYVAAAVVLAVTGLGIFRSIMAPSAFHRKGAVRQTYSAAMRIRKRLTLPDGTTVYLNNGSKLSLSLADFRNAATREVWLDEGEAYFEVAKNPSRPFIVHVDSLQARVLGTAFNIQAYRQLAGIQVLVSHGSVQVSASGSVLDTLVHNRQLTFFSRHHFYVSQIVTEQNLGWWNNRFVLNGASFKELALRLQLRFGVQLSSNNQRILQTSFSASFPETASLEEMLNVLCTLYKTSYHRVNNRIVIN
jgi:ferric-dicitrate binding protein FerR (iron transport regulator)